MFASVSSQGYAISPSKQRYCLYNENPNACNYGVGGRRKGFDEKEKRKFYK